MGKTLGLHRPHRKKSARLGCKPTLSGARNRRIPGLSYVLSESTQRESNPHILHGEQGGCRYITGASGTRGTRTLTTLVKRRVSWQAFFVRKSCHKPACSYATCVASVARNDGNLRGFSVVAVENPVVYRVRFGR